MAVDPVSQMLSGITNNASQQADYPPAVMVLNLSNCEQLEWCLM